MWCVLFAFLINFYTANSIRNECMFNDCQWVAPCREDDWFRARVFVLQVGKMSNEVCYLGSVRSMRFKRLNFVQDSLRKRIKPDRAIWSHNTANCCRRSIYGSVILVEADALKSAELYLRSTDWTAISVLGFQPFREASLPNRKLSAMIAQYTMTQKKPRRKCGHWN